jgi:hypothetical protein
MLPARTSIALPWGESTGIADLIISRFQNQGIVSGYCKIHPPILCSGKEKGKNFAFFSSGADNLQIKFT